MAYCRFDRVIVIGCGNIVLTTLKYIASIRDKYLFNMTYVRHEIQEYSSVLNLCDELNIESFRLREKKEVTAFFEKITEKTLVVSAGNHYLFPMKVLEKDNLTVINFHNALLPEYPGRNAPSWVIYCGEYESGATWHYVNKDIDAGTIIWQGKCLISEDTKAYELTMAIMDMAQKGLETFFEELLEKDIVGIKQDISPDRKIYYSYEVPGNGEFSIDDTAEVIYRLLRSLDYGKFGPFPKAHTVLPAGECVEIIRYKKQENADKIKEYRINNNEIEIPFDNEEALLLRFKSKT